MRYFKINIDRISVAKGAILGIMYLVAEGGFAIVITKLLTAKFDRDISGLFTVIIYCLSLSNILITSFGPALTRLIASAGFDGIKINSIIHSSKLVSIYCTFFLTIFYTINIFINNISEPIIKIVMVWIIFCIGHLFRLMGLFKCYEILGYGNVGFDRFYQFIFATIFGLTAIIILIYDLDLMALSLAYFFTGFLFWYFMYFIKKSPSQLNLKILPLDNSNINFSYSKELFINGLKLLLNNGTGYFIMNGDVFVVQFLFGDEYVAEYSMYSRLAALIVALCGLFPMMYYPLVANAWSKGDLVRCQKYRLDGIKMAFALLIASGLISIYSFVYIIEWSFPISRLVPGWFVYISVAYAAVSVFTVVNGMPILATGKNSLVSLSAINALLVVGLALLGGVMFGLYGVPLGALLGSLIPSFIYRKISISLFCG